MRTMIERARAVRWNSRPLVVVLAAAICVMAFCVAYATPALAAPGPVTGVTCTPACDLYATTGTLTLPGHDHGTDLGLLVNQHARVGRVAGAGADRHRWNGSRCYAT